MKRMIGLTGLLVFSLAFVGVFVFSVIGPGLDVASRGSSTSDPGITGLLVCAALAVLCVPLAWRAVMMWRPIRFVPGIGSVLLFVAALSGVAFFGFGLPRITSSPMTAAMANSAFLSLLVCAAASVLSVPFAWRGFINWRASRR